MTTMMTIKQANKIFKEISQDFRERHNQIR